MGACREWIRKDMNVKGNYLAVVCKSVYVGNDTINMQTERWLLGERTIMNGSCLCSFTLVERSTNLARPRLKSFTQVDYD